MAKANYRASGDEREQQRRDHGAEQLREPVDRGTPEGDASAHEQAERDRRVDVPTRRVARDRHRGHQRQRVRDGHREQAARRRRVLVQLPCKSDEGKKIFKHRRSEQHRIRCVRACM